MHGLAADPGRYGGIALVRRRVGKLPLLCGLWPIFGADHLWLRRARAAFEEAIVLVGDDTLVVGVENPPNASRTGSLRGDKRGQTTWRGIGRRKGMLEATWFHVHGDLAQTLEHKAWTTALQPHVKRKKVSDGTHRIREAAFLVEGAGDMLGAVRSTCRIDCAEAVLMGAALTVIASRR